MTSRIPDEVLDAIRARVSIVDVVGAHVALKRAGKNWKGLCPFHGEKTPSFIVNEERGTYHCFGCGVGGNAFRFLMEAEGRSFREAAELLAARAGVALRLGPEPEEDRRARQERDVLLELLELSARYYRHQLAEGRAGEAARAYLARRGIGAEAAEAFRLGCAPSGWDNLARYLAKKGHAPALASRAGLLSERASGGYYDRLRDRLVFPIADASGRVVSFGGRVMGEGEPKYLNGPESPVFHKSEVLYGLPQAAEALRREKRALLVEGYVDVVSLHAAGFRNALATLGTSLTREHVQALRRRVDEVVLVYDGDEAGRKAAFRSLELFLAGGLASRVVLLPGDHDPDSYVRSGGDLGARIAEARPLFDAFLAEQAARHDLGTVEGRLAAAEEMLPALAALSDPLARDAYAREAAEALGLSEEALRARLAKGPGAAERPQEAPSRGVVLDALERGLVACLLHEPAHRRGFAERGAAAWMRDALLRRAADFLAGRSEPAGSLPLHEVPADLSSLLSAMLVEAGPRPDSYEALESRIRLRDLDARSAELGREIQRAEVAGDGAEVMRLQQERNELIKVREQCRRRAGA